MNVDLSFWITIFLAGTIVGTLAGMFGVGGGFMLVPVLAGLLDIPVPIAVGTSVCQVLGPATSALLARRTTFGHLRLPLTIFGGLSIGVIAGAAALQAAGDLPPLVWHGREFPADIVLVLSIYFVMLSGLGTLTLADSFRSSVPRGWLRDHAIPPTDRFPDCGSERLSVPLLSWLGLVIGFLSGLLGISGGLMLVPALIYLFDIQAQQAVRNSLVIVWLISAQAAAIHAWYDRVDLLMMLTLMLGGTFGARIGATWSNRMPGYQLRRGFGVLLLVSALIVVVKAFRLWTQ